MYPFQIIGEMCTEPQLLSKYMLLTEKQPLVTE